MKRILLIVGFLGFFSCDESELSPIKNDKLVCIYDQEQKYVGCDEIQVYEAGENTVFRDHSINEVSNCDSCWVCVKCDTKKIMETPNESGGVTKWTFLLEKKRSHCGTILSIDSIVGTRIFVLPDTIMDGKTWAQWINITCDDY